MILQDHFTEFPYKLMVYTRPLHRVSIQTYGLHDIDLHLIVVARTFDYP